MMSPVSLLEARALKVSVGKRNVLDQVSLTLQPKRLLGVIGPNGAGKTMLMRTLIGMQSVESGHIELLGRSLTAWTAQERARKLTYLAQDAQVHWPLSVRDVVALGRLPHGDALTVAGQQAVEQAMAQTECLALAKRNVQALSGGERSRVLLARTLATQAPILLADEPLAALDPAHQLRMMALLRKIASQGVTVVIVLHDLNLAARFCDDLLVLHKGQMVADGNAQQVLTDAILHEVFALQVRRFEGQECGLVPWQVTTG